MDYEAQARLFGYSLKGDKPTGNKVAPPTTPDSSRMFAHPDAYRHLSPEEKAQMTQQMIEEHQRKYKELMKNG